VTIVDAGPGTAGVDADFSREDHRHQVLTAAPGSIAIGDAAAEGVAVSLARSDHVHALAAPAAPVNVTKAAAAAGVATAPARADHKHDITTAAPVTVSGGANSEGVATSLARSDHVHALDLVVEDEGVSLGSFHRLNFSGAGVTASDAGGGEALITIPGGGGGLLTAQVTSTATFTTTSTADVLITGMTFALTAGTWVIHFDGDYAPATADSEFSVYEGGVEIAHTNRQTAAMGGMRGAHGHTQALVVPVALTTYEVRTRSLIVATTTTWRNRSFIAVQLA
jgi:hypothetical protein